MHPHNSASQSKRCNTGIVKLRSRITSVVPICQKSTPGVSGLLTLGIFQVVEDQPQNISIFIQNHGR